MADSSTRPKRASAFRGSLVDTADNDEATSEEELPSSKKSKVTASDKKTYGEKIPATEASSLSTQQGDLRSMFTAQKKSGVKDVDVHAESKKPTSTKKKSKAKSSAREEPAARSSGRQAAAATSYRW
jgi:hypothetical protein